jgi:hypothetical protein
VRSTITASAAPSDALLAGVRWISGCRHAAVERAAMAGALAGSSLDEVGSCRAAHEVASSSSANAREDTVGLAIL